MIVEKINSAINSKLLEILNKSNFEQIYKNQGVLGDVVIEIKVVENNKNEVLLARVKRYCPCNSTDPPGSPCCYK